MDGSHDRCGLQAVEEVAGYIWLWWKGFFLYFCYLFFFSNSFFSFCVPFSPPSALLPGSCGVCFSAEQQSHGSDRQRRNSSYVPSSHHKARGPPVPGSDPTVASHKNKVMCMWQWLVSLCFFKNSLLEILFILLGSKINVFYTKFTAALAKNSIFYIYILHIFCMFKSFIEIFLNLFSYWNHYTCQTN